jgi:hypothetical protein
MAYAKHRQEIDTPYVGDAQRPRDWKTELPGSSDPTPPNGRLGVGELSGETDRLALVGQAVLFASKQDG